MKSLRTFLYRWHRRVGITAALFLLILAMTGIALNHGRDIGLHHIFTDNPLILSAYNMHGGEAARGQGVNLEKLLLDIHTGALFGLPGKLISDLAGLAMIFLTITGLYNQWKRKKNK